MTPDPNGQPPENRTMPRSPHAAGQNPPPRRRLDPVEPPPTVKQRVQAPPPPPPSDFGPPPVGGPQIPGAAPPRRRDLDPDRWGYGAFTPPPPPPPAGTPGPPPPPARRGRAWIALAVAVLVAAAAVIITIVVTSGDDPAPTGSPSATVQTYLRDLAAHDASDALAQGDAPSSRTFLTDDILRRQQLLAPISGVHIAASSTDGDHARVRAQYRFGTRTADTTYLLTLSNGRWRLDQTAFPLDVSMLAGVPSATVFDKPVGGVRTIELFPGPVQWGSGNKYFVVSQKNADRFALSPADPDASYADIAAGLNADGIAALKNAASMYVKSCAKSRSLRPPKCPQQEFGDHAIKNTATWTLASSLNRALRFKAMEEENTTFMLDANLRWVCVYSVPAAKGRTRRVTDSMVQGALSGTVDLTAAEPVFTASN